MKVAQAKIEMIKPDEVNMEEYEASILYEKFPYMLKKCCIFIRILQSES